ncbi:hypothetical protein [Streptomyces sp. NPDC046805]|uniref:hypothetical protein n=1 Tax=Streptomyces sp. NPDC046805 TaxID=3155134 RepID=UPI0033CA0BC5
MTAARGTSALRVVRRHTAVQVSPGGRESRAELALRAESDQPGQWHLATHAPDSDGENESENKGKDEHEHESDGDSDELASRARTARRVLVEKAWPVLRGNGPLVEAGHTGTEVVCDGRTVRTSSRAYLLVRDGDHVLHLGDGPVPEDTVPWVRDAGPDEIRADDPVLLGPSALLALMAALQEELGATAPERAALPTSPPSPSPSPPRTPYPPHDLSLPVLPPVLTGGRSTDDLRQAAELLGDPTLWLVPHGTFGDFAAWDVAAADRPEVDAERLPLAAPPPRALIIDSLIPRARSAAGALDWTAGYRMSDRSGTGRGTEPLRLRGAPAELLAAAEARCGPRLPGLGRDPIGRPYYRLVPTVSTSLNAGRMLAR